MTKKELDKNGVKLLEQDRYDGGIYLGTNTLYLYNGEIFAHTYNNNSMRYAGKENYIEHLGSREQYFKYEQDYWWRENLTPAGKSTLTEHEKQSFRYKKGFLVF